MSTEHMPTLREALLDLAQIKCDELLVDMRFLLALYDKYKRGPITEGPDVEHLATIREYLSRAAKRA